MKRIVTVIFAALMLISLLGGCSGDGAEMTSPTPDASVPPTQSEAPSPAGTKRENFIFTDDVGRQVEVDGEITRIAASGPMAQIALFAIAPEMFVGVSNEWDPEVEGIIPDEYYNLPIIGQLYGGKGEMNLEELAFLDPQLVIDVGEAKGSIVEDLNGLQEQTGVTFVHIDSKLETLPETYRRLGELLDKEEEGETLAQYCEEIWGRAMGIMDKVGDNRADVVYCLGADGLNVLANTSFHAEVVDLLTNNVAVVGDASSKGSGNAVDMEQLLIWDPEYILFAPDGSFDAASTPEWQQLSAVKSGKNVEIPGVPYNWMASPPSVQRYLGLIWLPAILYPDYVDYDVFEECAEYFRFFYHTELTRETFDSITANSFPA
jgi:iron complex transport system substrate-binding protein